MRPAVRKQLISILEAMDAAQWMTAGDIANNCALSHHLSSASVTRALLGVGEPYVEHRERTVGRRYGVSQYKLKSGARVRLKDLVPKAKL